MRFLGTSLVFGMAVLATSVLYLAVWSGWSLSHPKAGETLVWNLFAALVLVPIVAFIFYLPLCILFVVLERTASSVSVWRAYLIAPAVTLIYSAILFNVNFSGNLVFAVMDRNEGVKNLSLCLSVIGSCIFVYLWRSTVAANGTLG